MDVQIEELMEQVNADDSEKPVLIGMLRRAKSAALIQINRPYSDLDENEQQMFDQIVLDTATNYYLSRNGMAKGSSKSFTSVDSLIEVLRKPPLGGDIDE